MIALVDCNNFYASCERAFNPNWNNRPVVVLSNNDGCVIARSNEAKALGIKMGVPAYQIKNEIERYGIGVFSSNYTLYGDMSNRVMTMLSSYSPNIEVYSIDECFLDFSGFERYDLKEYGEEIVRTVSKGTGIPVSMVSPRQKLSPRSQTNLRRNIKGIKACVSLTRKKNGSRRSNGLRSETYGVSVTDTRNGLPYMV